MLFNILTFNHGDRYIAIERMDPIVRWTKEVISKCGHEVIIGYNEIYPGAIQLLFENFPSTIPVGNGGFISWNKVFESLKNQHKVQVGVIATELIIDGIIPYATDSMTRIDVSDRVKGFHLAIERADFTWCFLERTANSYKKEDNLIKFLPVGSLGVIPKESRRSPKDIDILFFGKATPHRVSAIKKFADAGLHVFTLGVGWREGSFSAPAYLASMIDRSKIILNLTLSESTQSSSSPDARFASCMRIVEILSRGGLIASERIPQDNPYDRFMISAAIEDLPRICKAILQDDSWRNLGEKLSDLFDKEMNAEQLCKPVIDQTLLALGHSN